MIGRIEPTYVDTIKGKDIEIEIRKLGNMYNWTAKFKNGKIYTHGAGAIGKTDEEAKDCLRNIYSQILSE